MQEVYMYNDCRTLHLYLVWLKRENAKHEYLSVSYIDLYSFTIMK